MRNEYDVKNIALVKQSRLSVMPIKEVEWDEIINLSLKSILREFGNP